MNGLQLTFNANEFLSLCLFTRVNRSIKFRHKSDGHMTGRNLFSLRAICGLIAGCYSLAFALDAVNHIEKLERLQLKDSGSVKTECRFYEHTTTPEGRKTISNDK